MTVSHGNNAVIMPDIVVFDVGNVLIEWDPRHLYRKLFDDEATMEKFLSEICTDAWNMEQDRGRSFEEAIEERVALFPEFEAEIRAYDTGWHDMVPGEVPGTPALLGELKEAGVPLYAITNFSREKFVEARKRFTFLDTSFIDTVVSAHEGIIKPDQRIFEILFERNSLDPARTIFIDDSPKNVEGARAAGMHAHHFRDADILRQDLISLGFPVAAK